MISKMDSAIVPVGHYDPQQALFEGQYCTQAGMSYNSYVILDEKIAVLDGVEGCAQVMDAWRSNLEKALAGRKPDYLIIHHMEPDHSGSIAALAEQYPEMTIVGNAKTFPMLSAFTGQDFAGRTLTVKEGDKLELGGHTLTFFMAPMVHWPEVMVSYESASKTLFSADGFGRFGDTDPDSPWVDEARRYYINIVGKYGVQVQALLKKAAALDIQAVCPLHGPIWRKDIGWFVEKYQRWSSYTPEHKTAAIFCGSIYGNTENAAEILAARLADKGVKDVRLYDVSHTHVSELVAEAFRCSHLVFAAATYNNGIFTPMENLLLDLKAHNLQGRTAAVVENGSWGPQAGKLMREILSGMKNMTVLESGVTLKSSVQAPQREALLALADAIAAELV